MLWSRRNRQANFCHTLEIEDQSHLKRTDFAFWGSTGWNGLKLKLEETIRALICEIADQLYFKVFLVGLGTFTDPKAKIHVETEEMRKFPRCTSSNSRCALRLQEDDIEFIQSSKWAAPQYCTCLLLYVPILNQEGSTSIKWQRWAVIRTGRGWKIYLT